MDTTRRTFLTLALGSAGTALAGCAPSTSSPTSSAPLSGSPIATDGASLGNVTISMMDTWTDKASLQAKWMESVNAAFTAKYPNIKVTRTSMTFDDVNKTLKLKLSDASAPDIVPANNGWQGIGVLAKAGLIRNLDDYAKAYGWGERIPDTLARMHQVTTDGKSIGKGSWFGVPMAQGGFITVYYNRSKVDKLGGLPTTFAGFDEMLAKAKAAGEIPMMIGTQDQWLSTTTLFALMCVYGDPKKISDFVYGIGGTAAETGLLKAAETYQRWSKSGYLPENFAGTPGTDSGTQFVEGKGVFYFYYSDSLPFTDAKQTDSFGTFLLPTESGTLAAVGSSNQNFSIGAKAKNPDAAALWLDFVSSKAAGDLAMQGGIMPFLDTFEATASTGALLKDEIAELNAMQKSNAYVPYFDWASPTMLDTMGAQAQLLLAGKITPQQMVDACQKDYDAFKATQG